MSDTSTQAKAKEPVKTTKFSISRLRKDCFSLFGVTVSTFDGATHGLTGNYTVDEMKARIEKWGAETVSTATTTKRKGTK